MKTTTLVDVADELVQRALAARRRPLYFTIGRDTELKIASQLFLNQLENEDWQSLEEYGVDALSINGLPVHRMAAAGIALHTEELR